MAWIWEKVKPVAMKKPMKLPADVPSILDILKRLVMVYSKSACNGPKYVMVFEPPPYNTKLTK